MKNRAFTLTEILIVIGLIVLILAIAVPSLSFMSGSNSIEGAQNQISAMLGRARAEAIGLQEPVGVMFLLSPSTDRIELLLVNGRQPPYVSVGQPKPPSDIYLEAMMNYDRVSLPPGITLQVIDDAIVTGGVRQDDGYLGYNDLGGGPKLGGVILFDSFGKTELRSYGFLIQNSDGTPTAMSELLNISGVEWIDFPVSGSDFGFVLMQRSPLADRFDDFNPDPQLNGTAYDANERAEEDWIDANSTPFIINRYNGTLVKGE